jgi:hypothetical protein
MRRERRQVADELILRRRKLLTKMLTNCSELHALDVIQ